MDARAHLERERPAMIAAAWKTWRVRNKQSIGPGPGFAEAIDAALDHLAAAGYIIIHDSENHGPTRDRAAGTVEKANYPCVGDARRIASSIRAMEVNQHG